MNVEEPVAEVVIVEDDFDVAAEYAQLCKRAPRSGAVVFFVGLVRDLYEPAQQQESAQQHETVDYIDLQHYEGMTEALCGEIVEQARARYGFDAVRLIHRVGKIYAGEQIVMVAVASHHRQKAFAAVQFIMDYLKTRATLWKKEVGSRGELWIGLKDKDADAADCWSETNASSDSNSD